MPVNYFDPTLPARDDKLLVETAPTPELDREALKALIAEKVRADSRERGALTPEHAVRALAPALNRDELGALLGAMAADSLFADVKALVAPSGRVYLFSEAHVTALEAAEKGRIEEARFAVVERIRADSRRTLLTPAAELEPLLPFTEPEARAAFLAEIRADERFKDIQVVAGPKGETYYHSDDSLSGNYATIMMRARVNDPHWAIAELVRDRSKIMPAPTKITLFRDPVFQILNDKIDGHVQELLEKPEYADIKKLVQKKTGAVYLYSTRWLDERRARYFMDWEEVGVYENP